MSRNSKTIDRKPEIPLTENARAVLERRYLRKGEDGKPIETVEEMFHRVANTVATVDADYGQDVERTTQDFYDLLTSLRFFPNSPTFTGAGTPLGQLAACFVLPIEDDMGRDPAGIFSTLRVAALIQQTGGGNGFSFSRLRPRGDIVKTSNGVATGPVGFLRVYDKAFGEVAQGGCLVPETLVFTAEGLLRLDEVVAHEQPGWRPHELLVATDEGMRLSPQAYNNGVVPVVRVKTDAGLELTGTPDHKVKVMTPDGPAWCRLQDLQPGDAIMVKLGQHRGRVQHLAHPERRHGNQVMPELPTMLDEELAFFLGYMAGDGSAASGGHDHRIGVTVAHDSYLIDEMAEIMGRLFGGHLTVHRMQKENDASVTFALDNRAVKEFLMLNGLHKGRSTEVSVPRLIRQSPANVVGAFLRGLFEAGGAVSHGYPQLLSSSERLIRETAALLIGLGCPVRIFEQSTTPDRYGQANIWALRVHSFKGLQSWREHVGCDPRSRFNACMVFQPDLAREVSYALPHAEYWVSPVLEATQLPQIDRRERGQGGRFRSTVPELRRPRLRYTQGDRQLTLSGYELLSEKYDAFAEHARTVDDMWFVTVTSVEGAGERLTLDLEVEENHTYLANGFVTHNTRRGANMAVLRVDHPDIRDFIRCKAQEGEITNFNISVGITDAFMRAVENDEDFDLVNPRDGSVWETVRAREIFDEIVRHAHRNGEPGVLFLDTANRDNPVPHLYELEATNPCVTGDTLVATPHGWRRADSIRVGDEIVTTSGIGRVAEIEVNHSMPVYRVQFSDGGSLRVTASHQFYVRDPQTGAFLPRRLDTLRIGDEVQVLRPIPIHATELALAVYGSTPQTSSIELEVTSGTARVLSITPAGIETVYDLYEPQTDTWITEGYVSRGCGEQWLGPYENCCLGSINLAQHVTEQGDIDWEKLRDSIERATHFLDNVVSANKYVPAVPELEKAAHTARRIGLGIMGLADLMYHQGVRYGSKDGEELAAQVMEFVRFHCMKTSIELARQRGPFPAIKGSIYDPEDLKWKPPAPLTPYKRDFGRPPLDWNEIVEGIQRYGIRNAAQTTVAPTGTIATVAGCEGYGCEPVFALAYIRHVQDGEKELDLQYTSPLFRKALIEAGIDEESRHAIYDEVMRTGTCQHIETLPEHIRHTFVVASDITPEEHVRMQAAIQRFVDNSISKCVAGDTLVMTAEGLRPIAALSDLRQPDQFEPLDVELITPAGKEKADAFYYGGFRETRKVRFSYGFELEGTPNHRIQVLSADGTVKWRRLDELKIGDTAILYTGQFSFGRPGQSLPAYSGEFRTRAKAVQFPTHMSVDLAFLLGCLVSDGAITQNGVFITNSDPELLKRLAAHFKHLFGLDSHIQRDLRRESLFILQVNSRPLRNWMLADLGMETGASNKIIPSCIWKASRDEQAAFMRGLMLDGFVTADGRMWGLTLASRELVRQVHTLLLNFDVVGTMRQSGENAWEVTVAGGELEKLSDFISFEEKWKIERLARRNRGRQQRFRNYSRLLPEAVTSELRQMQEASGKSLRACFGGQTRAYQRTRVNLLQGHRLEREDGRQLFQHFVETATPLATNFFAHDERNRVYVTVQAIEAGFNEVFDVSVPVSHSFIANGFGNHNTCNFPATATEEDVARAYMMAWELGCKGLTVYVTGTREKVVLETKATLEAKQKGEAVVQSSDDLHSGLIKKPRPRKLRGYTYKQATPLGTAYVNITEDEEGHPFEVFLNVGKGGSDTSAAAEAIGRLISLVLRLPSPRSPEERLREVIAELSDIGGGRRLGFGAQRVSSLPDGVAKALAEHLRLPDVPAPPLASEPGGNGPAHFTDDYCPECGQATLVREEGCRKCYTCGFSEC